jgi:hypothetical protein
MPQSHIHQIFYSAETRQMLDPGFIPLDNAVNERPDWREYWPMRRFLLNNALNETDYYGFFSPKFGAKTGLASAAVHTFIQAQPADTDVVLFSPFFDQIAFYRNIFEQGITHHHGFLEAFRGVAQHVAPGQRLEELVMDSRNTVYCNFFAAKPAFWRAWLEKCEVLFAIAEANDSVLAAQLNANVKYGNAGAPGKVFAIERIASLLLVTQPNWNVAVHDPLKLPIDTLFAGFELELLCLDALKIASAMRDSKPYLEAFQAIRKHVAETSKARHLSRQAAQKPTGKG